MALKPVNINVTANNNNNNVTGLKRPALASKVSTHLSSSSHVLFVLVSSRRSVAEGCASLLARETCTREEGLLWWFIHLLRATLDLLIDDHQL